MLSVRSVPAGPVKLSALALARCWLMAAAVPVRVISAADPVVGVTVTPVVVVVPAASTPSRAFDAVSAAIDTLTASVSVPEPKLSAANRIGLLVPGTIGRLAGNWYGLAIVVSDEERIAIVDFDSMLLVVFASVTVSAGLPCAEPDGAVSATLPAARYASISALVPVRDTRLLRPVTVAVLTIFCTGTIARAAERPGTLASKIASLSETAISTLIGAAVSAPELLLPTRRTPPRANSSDIPAAGPVTTAYVPCMSLQF